MLKMLLFAALCGVAGCSPVDVGSDCLACNETCLHGVVYLLPANGVTPEYNPDGSLRACGGVK